MTKASREQIEHLWRRACLHHENGEHVQAIAVLAELARCDPSADVYTALATEYRALGDIYHSYEALRAALQCDPHDADALFALGNLHTAEGRHDAAAEVYDYLVQCCPEMAEAYMNLGNALARLARYPEAKIALLAAIRYGSKSPLYPLILYNLARVCAESGSPNAAIDVLLGVGVQDDELAMRACLDDAFLEAREHDRFRKIAVLAERRIFAHLSGLRKQGGAKAVEDALVIYPYLQQIIRTHEGFERFRPFLPSSSGE